MFYRSLDTCVVAGYPFHNDVVRPDIADGRGMVGAGMFRRIVRSLPLEVRSLGVEIWEHRLDALDFTEWSELRRLKDWVRLAQRLRLIELVRFIGRRLDLFTPIILTARKNHP